MKFKILFLEQKEKRNFQKIVRRQNRKLKFVFKTETKQKLPQICLKIKRKVKTCFHEEREKNTQTLFEGRKKINFFRV